MKSLCICILCLIVAPLAASINTDQIINDAYTTTTAIINAPEEQLTLNNTFLPWLNLTSLIYRQYHTLSEKKNNGNHDIQVLEDIKKLEALACYLNDNDELNSRLFNLAQKNQNSENHPYLAIFAESYIRNKPIKSVVVERKLEEEIKYPSNLSVCKEIQYDGKHLNISADADVVVIRDLYLDQAIQVYDKLIHHFNHVAYFQACNAHIDLSEGHFAPGI